MQRPRSSGAATTLDPQSRRPGRAAGAADPDPGPDPDQDADPSSDPSPDPAPRDDRAETDDGFGPWGHRSHVHADDQFLAALTGEAIVEAAGKRFRISENRGLWIPAGVPHSAIFLPGFAPFMHRTGTETRLVEGPHALTLSSGLRARLVATLLEDADPTAILREALLTERGSGSKPCRAAQDHAVPGPAARPGSETARLASAPLNGPITSAIGEMLRTNPADDRTLDDWARKLHSSATTIRRAFHDELGTSYTSWRTAVRLEASAALLRRGTPVANAARAVGLSHNGLIAAYRRHYGCRPSEIRGL